jgi:hypothetical protein
LPPVADHPLRVGIVYSETSAGLYFGGTDAGKTAYSQLFMAAQNQAAAAGVPFDVLSEADLKDLAKISGYDALIFPLDNSVLAAKNSDRKAFFALEDKLRARYLSEAGLSAMPATLSEYLSRVGHEFGSVTGRRRRCGWFDAVALRRSIVHSSCSLLCVTKLDVLDGLDTIRVCVGYKVDGGVALTPPLLSENFGFSQAVYEDLPGWKESTVGITRYDDLPANARSYLERLQSLVCVPITMISTGPDRDQTIIRQNPFG